uniref:Uncharacterized protein n=1 Tax=Euplotes harpa TaxID=151035 RepID=A0A7S3JAU0_9SPIT|mmetsp:Transcript_24796/g.28490  ORF Transcript_24796/g.28490 Transcript_24796/m.28490 type:complete len:208 (+) Transcript_24796:176-799(+)
MRLELKSCNIRDPKPLYYLENLYSLVLQNNQIQELEDVAPFLSTIQYLNTLDLRDNPLAGIKKYRDQIIMIGLKIETLDDKKVTEHEREYLITLEMKKKGIKVPKKNNGFGVFSENIGFRSNISRIPKGKVPLKPVKKVVTKPLAKTGLTIVGNEMEIHSALESREGAKRTPGADSGPYKPQDQYPTFEQLMKMASLPPNVKVNKNK